MTLYCVDAFLTPYADPPSLFLSKRSVWRNLVVAEGTCPLPTAYPMIASLHDPHVFRECPQMSVQIGSSITKAMPVKLCGFACGFGVLPCNTYTSYNGVRQLFKDMFMGLMLLPEA